MVRAIGFAKRRVGPLSLLVAGVGLAVACTKTEHNFGAPPHAVAGEAGHDTNESDGGAGATASNGGASGDASSGNSGSSSVGASAGEGGAPPSEDGAPVVVSVSPEDASDDAEPGVSVKITFNEALQADTVTLDSVKLYDGDVEVEGEVRYAGKVVTFTPVANLSLLASYRVSISTALTDLSGVPLKKAFNASFQVRDGVWSVTRTDLSPDDEAVTQVSAAADGNGNILFAWVEAGPPLNVSARWYHSGIGWDPKPQNLDSGTVGSPTVAVSPEGDAVVVWVSASSYMAKRCLATKWEGTAKKLGTVTTTPKAPVASVRKGRLLAAWPVGIDNGAHFNWAVHANTASGEGAWQADPTPVWTTTVDNLSVRDPSLKQDANGDGFLVFELAKTSFRQLFSATFADSGAIWSTAAAIDGTTALVTDTGQGYSLAVADTGDALVAWALKGQLMAGRYTKKTKAFATPTEIDTLESDPIIAVTGGAQAVGDDFWVAWTQINGTPANVYANRYVAGDKAWDGAKLLSDGVTSATPPLLGVDHHGNVHAAWLQPAAPKAPAVAARFSAEAWAKPITLYAGADAPTSIAFASAGSGQAAAVLMGGKATRLALFE